MSDQNNSNSNSPTERLSKLLGFDPSKATRLTGELFEEVVKDITKERTEAAKTKAKELLTKAIKLREDAATITKKFNSDVKKFDKELGKVIGAVQALLEGRTAPTEEEDENDSK